MSEWVDESTTSRHIRHTAECREQMNWWVVVIIWHLLSGLNQMSEWVDESMSHLTFAQTTKRNEQMSWWVDDVYLYWLKPRNQMSKWLDELMISSDIVSSRGTKWAIDLMSWWTQATPAQHGDIKWSNDKWTNDRRSNELWPRGAFYVPHSKLHTYMYVCMYVCSQLQK